MGRPMKFECDCGKSVQIPESAVGRKGVCPTCKQVFVVPLVLPQDIPVKPPAGEIEPAAGPGILPLLVLVPAFLLALLTPLLSAGLGVVLFLVLSAGPEPLADAPDPLLAGDPAMKDREDPGPSSPPEEPTVEIPDRPGQEPKQSPPPEDPALPDSGEPDRPDPEPASVENPPEKAKAPPSAKGDAAAPPAPSGPHGGKSRPEEKREKPPPVPDDNPGGKKGPASPVPKKKSHEHEEERGGLNERAASRVIKTIAVKRPKGYHIFRTAKKTDVIVIKGKYDRVEDVLDALKVEYTVIQPGDLEKFKLNPNRQLLLCNCSDHEDLSIRNAAVRRLRAFVKAGGFFFSTDWGILLTQRIFKGTIYTNQEGMEGSVVNAEINPACAKHPLLRDVFPVREQSGKQTTYGTVRWSLDAMSYPIRIRSSGKSRVYVLITGRTPKNKRETVAASFWHGRGLVLHVTSHFHQVNCRLEDAMGMQYLIVNFIIEKMRRAR
jgi:hypothetical protein